MARSMTWALEDHLCKACGGRILRSVSGAGPTGGGNPIFKCADCGVSTSDMGPSCLCWCGMRHRNQTDYAYMCLPYEILKEYPELLRAFRACGCDPERGEVGIVTAEDYRKYLDKKEK